MSNVSTKGKWQEKRTPFQKFLSALGLVLCIVFGFTLICNLTIIIKGTLYPEQPPSVLGVTPMVVKSGSMSGSDEGHIEIGDLIFVNKADPQELEVGDVIAFMEGSVVVTHRIVEIQTDDNGQRQFITKGDANNAEDQRPVTEDRLVGIYRSRIPRVGDFVLFMQTPLGMLIFIGLPVLALLTWDYARRWKSSAQEKKRTSQLEAELARLQQENEQLQDSAKK